MWTEIIKHHSISFNNYHRKQYSKHKNKFRWLLYNLNINKFKKIERINYYCNIDESKTTEQIRYSFLKKNDTLNMSEINLTINIDPSKFNMNGPNPLNHTNKKWFINLTNSDIPSQVSNLLQLGSFCSF